MTGVKRATSSHGLSRGTLSANAAVARAIGRRIVGGEFPEGSILPKESAWVEEFSVSRSVVREAIKVLSAKGLLTSRPKVGSRVAPRQRWNLLDPDVLSWYAEAPDRRDFLVSLQQFRRIFEPEAAALAARNRSEAQMAAISAACSEMGSATSLVVRGDADVRFHLEILGASGNDLLLPLGVLVEEALNTLFVSINRAAGNIRHAQTLHEAIEKAIRLKRPEAARRAVRRLLENSDAMLGEMWAEAD